jgi:beta-glucosidase
MLSNCRFVRGGLIKQGLGCGKLLPVQLDACVREVLKLIKRVSPLNIEEDAEESTLDTPETAASLRAVASQGLVLLKNENNLLPLKKEKSTAIIGPNAAISAYCGGGSASLLPYYAISPLEGIRNVVPEAKFEMGTEYDV